MLDCGQYLLLESLERVRLATGLRRLEIVQDRAEIGLMDLQIEV